MFERCAYFTNHTRTNARPNNTTAVRVAAMAIAHGTRHKSMEREHESLHVAANGPDPPWVQGMVQGGPSTFARQLPMAMLRICRARSAGAAQPPRHPFNTRCQTQAQALRLASPDRAGTCQAGKGQERTLHDFL